MRKRVILILLVIAVVLGVYKVLTVTIPIREKDLNYENFSKIKVKDPSKFSFVVLGDNKNSYSTFDHMIRDINRHADEISFVMNTGDLVFDGDNLKYRLFLDQIEELKVPHMVVPGNHDLYDEGVNLYHKIFGAFYYSFVVGKSLFIVLDDANEVRVDPQQLYWLKKRMKESWNYAHTFCFMHVPLFDPRPHEHHCLKDRENAKKVLSILKEGKIDMVFCGHIHSYFRGSWDGVPYTITAGAGAFYYSFVVGKSLFIVLDDANEVRVDPQQLYWLKKRMKESWNYAHTFCFMHVPLFDPRPHEHHCLKDRENAKKVLSILKEGKIDMVFCGHIHSYFRGSWDGVPYTITAGAGAELMGVDPKHYFYHYVIVNVNGDKVTYSVKKFFTPPYDYPLRISYDILLYILAFLRQQYLLILMILFLYVSFRLYHEKGLIAFVKALVVKVAADIKETSDKMRRR